MMTTLELEKKIKQIDELIFNEIVSENVELFPVYDGVINIEKYCSAKFKILWILKEPYDDFDKDKNPIGGGWSLTKVLNEKENLSQFKSGLSTYIPMIYTSWGILNDFRLWSEMENVNNNPNMLDALKSIGYINVKKIPGNTTSPKSVIDKAYIEYKHILLRQIESYNPQIIIGGSTLYNFFDDLGIAQAEMIRSNSLNYIIIKGKIYIDAYHPAQRFSSTGITEEVYCNDIINLIKTLSTKI